MWSTPLPEKAVPGCRHVKKLYLAPALKKTTMTDRDKQRLDELEMKTAYLLARQDEQTAKMHQITARLVYIEARQYRLMKEIGIDPEKIDTAETAKADAQAINLLIISEQRWN